MEHIFCLRKEWLSDLLLLTTDKLGIQGKKIKKDGDLEVRNMLKLLMMEYLTVCSFRVLTTCMICHGRCGEDPYMGIELLLFYGTEDLQKLPLLLTGQISVLIQQQLSMHAIYGR